MPLAQSGPVVQLVFGNDPEDSQSPPVHLPLRQSLACEHAEPGSEPVGDPGDPEAPPFDDGPP
jgi:hypothetical protein